MPAETLKAVNINNEDQALSSKDVDDNKVSINKYAQSLTNAIQTTIKDEKSENSTYKEKLPILSTLISSFLINFTNKNHILFADVLLNKKNPLFFSKNKRKSEMYNIFFEILNKPLNELKELQEKLKLPNTDLSEFLSAEQKEKFAQCVNELKANKAQSSTSTQNTTATATDTTITASIPMTSTRSEPSSEIKTVEVKTIESRSTEFAENLKNIKVQQKKLLSLLAKIKELNEIIDAEFLNNLNRDQFASLTSHIKSVRIATSNNINTIEKTLNEYIKKYEEKKQFISFNEEFQSELLHYKDVLSNFINKTEIPHKESKETSAEDNPRNMLIYADVMTKLSIYNDDPTRKYLNDLYQDLSLLTLYFETAEGKKEKKYLRQIEQNLEREIYSRYEDQTSKLLAQHHDPKTIANTQSTIIHENISEAKNPAQQAKSIEHWINVMQIAVGYNKEFIANVIKQTLSTFETDLSHEWLDRPLISQKSKTFYKAYSENQPQSIDEYLESLAQPTPKKIAEEKKSADPVDQQKMLNLLMHEIISTEKSFQEGMHALKTTLEDKAKQNKQDDFKTLATMLADTMKYDLAPNYTLDAKQADLKTSLDNLDKIIAFFNSNEFSQTLQSCETATYNLEWTNKFLQTNGIKNIDVKGKITSVSAITITPIQRIPRYILLLNELLKKLTELSKNDKLDDRDQLDRLEKKIKEIESKLNQIQQKATEINKNRLQREEENADQENRSAQLAHLNYTISMHLLNHVDDLDKKTQDSLMYFSYQLSNNPATSPQESWKFLNEIELSNTDKIKNHRLHRRLLKTIIADYFENQNKIMAKNLIKNHAKKDILLYLNELQNEWIARDACLKKHEEKSIEHSKYRLKLISDAITVIETYGTPKPEIASTTYQILQARLRNIPSDSKLISRTVDVSKVDLMRDPNPFIKNVLKSYDEVLSEPQVRNEFSQLLSAEFKNDKDTAIIELNTLAQLNVTTVKFKENLSKQITNLLLSIKNSWIAAELDDDSVVMNSHAIKRKELIEKALFDLNSITEPNIQHIINQLYIDLENASKTPTSFSHSVTRYFSKDEKTEILRTDTKARLEDIQLIQGVLAKIYSANIAEQKHVEAKERKDVELKTQELKRTFIEDRSIIPPDEKKEITFKGSRSILKLFHQAVEKEHPLFTKKYSNVTEFALDEKKMEALIAVPSNNWRHLKSGLTSELDDKAAPSIDAKVDANLYPELKSGHYNEFSNMNGSVIRQTRQGNYMQISIVKKSDNYNELKATNSIEQHNIDLENASTMIRLWIKNNGNSSEARIPISDSADKNTMQALVIVCEANGLFYHLPYKSKYNYDFVTDVSVLQPQILECEERIARNPTSRIRKHNIAPETIEELSTELTALKRYYKTTIKRTFIADSVERKYYKDEIAKLGSLLQDAKDDKLSAKSLNEAIQSLRVENEEKKPDAAPVRHPSRSP